MRVCLDGGAQMGDGWLTSLRLSQPFWPLWRVLRAGHLHGVVTCVVAQALCSSGPCVWFNALVSLS